MISLSNLNFDEFNAIFLYGIGTFVLMFLSIYAILFFQIYNLKNERAGMPVYSVIFKIFYFYIGVLSIVIIFISAIITTSHTKTGNPAVGIYGFYKLDWSDMSSSGALSKIKIAPVYTNAGSAEKSKIIVEAIAIGVAKFMYEILLIATFFIAMIFAFHYPYSDCKQQFDSGKNAFQYCFGKSAMYAVFFIVLSYSLLKLEEGGTNYLISYAINNNFAENKIEATISNIDVIKNMFVKVRNLATP